MRRQLFRIERTRRAVVATTTRPALLICSLLLCLFCGVMQAQSGRRSPPPRADPPVPTPTPEPAKPKPAPIEPTRVLVTVSSPVSVALSTFDANIVADTFLQRLRSSDGLRVETADRMSRDSARKRAKTEEGRYVVWLELQTNGIDTDISGVRRPYPEDLHIQYIIYEPGTGQMRTNGNVYLRPSGSVPAGRPGAACYPSRMYGYQGALMIGAIETANRVFAAFALPEPPLCP
jgi:hypothetical protein